MTKVMRFFDGSQYSESDFAKFMKRIMKHDGVLATNGVDPAYGGAFWPGEHNPPNMSVDMSPGIAWIQGGEFESDQNANIILSDSTGLPRYDRIVVRLNWIANSIDFAVLEGTPNASPTLKALTRTDSQWELEICNIYVGAGVTAIYQDDIVDTRTTDTCGIAGCPLGAAFVEPNGDISMLNTYRFRYLPAPYYSDEAVNKAYVDGTFAGLASPAFTGTPTAPTPLRTVGGTRIPTCDYVRGMFISSQAAGATQKLLDTNIYSATVTSVIKILQMPQQYFTGSVFTVKFDIKTVNGPGIFSVGGLAGGGASKTSSDAAYTSYTFDITLYTPGDVLSFVITVSPGTTCYVKNIAIWGYDIPFFSKEIWAW